MGVLISSEVGEDPFKVGGQGGLRVCSPRIFWNPEARKCLFLHSGIKFKTKN